MWKSIVDAEDERGAFCTVALEAECEGHGFVAMRFYFLMSWLKAKMPASLRPYTMTVHAAADFEIDVVVICDVDVVTGIVPDFLWNDGGLDGYVLEV